MINQEFILRLNRVEEAKPKFEASYTKIKFPSICYKDGEPSSCYVWNKEFNDSGEPVFEFEGDKILASKFMLYIIAGEKIDNRKVINRCGNIKCVSPIHLDFDGEKSLWL